ncbi:HAMP domain-containing histidine kinase [Schaalia sp. 19OD2882]|uniref:sensor histidine kinase n=1 Tax=Schaalia sp. 19OD2882 TaxID=2794089 RepID=UPI001C1EC17F|nr:HAMP domain-containing sensor histidine kinase [Schaalia sp. 19OD2882]QWW19746.1 HAMP domain-containing histidine kinase [Schaalia sp. 19OD2882]
MSPPAIAGWSFAVVLALALWATWLRLRRSERARRAAEEELRVHTNRPAVIAHEIRTPLALIRGAGELLEEGLAGDLNDQQSHFVHTITQNTQQVIDLTESIITDLKLSTAGSLVTEVVDVRDIVATTAREMRRITATPIHVDATGGVLAIRANAPMLRQVVWNLMNNALRHAHPDTTVTVSVSGTEDGGAQITVEDRGSGIPEDEQQAIFAPFETGSTHQGGSGIGLMVSQRIVKAHGGRILVDSLPERGTVVHVVLPGGGQ